MRRGTMLVLVLGAVAAGGGALAYANQKKQKKVTDECPAGLTESMKAQLGEALGVGVLTKAQVRAAFEAWFTCIDELLDLLIAELD